MSLCCGQRHVDIEAETGGLALDTARPGLVGCLTRARGAGPTKPARHRRPGQASLFSMWASSSIETRWGPRPADRESLMHLGQLRCADGHTAVGSGRYPVSPCSLAAWPCRFLYHGDLEANFFFRLRNPSATNDVPASWTTRRNPQLGNNSQDEDRFHDGCLIP